MDGLAENLDAEKWMGEGVKAFWLRQGKYDFDFPGFLQALKGRNMNSPGHRPGNGVEVLQPQRG